MKRLILLLGWLLSATPAFATVAHVGNANGNCSSGSSCATSAYSLTAGHTVAVWVSWDDGNNTTSDLSSLSDTAGNTFTSRSSGSAAGGSRTVFFQLLTADNVTGNGSNVFTANFAISVNHVSVLVEDMSGGASAAYDVAASGTCSTEGSCATNWTTGSFSTALADEMVVCGGSMPYTSQSHATAGTGYTVGTFNDNDGVGTLEYQIFSSTQSGITASMVGPGSGLSWAIACVGLKGSGGGGGSVTHTLTLLGVGR